MRPLRPCLAILFASSLLPACSSDDTSSTGSMSSSSTGSASGGGGAGGGSGGAGQGGCGADEHADQGACSTSIMWDSGPGIAIPRDHHATFLVDPGPSSSRFLYVAGGFSQASSSLLTSVVRAPVGDDGKLGAWEAGTDLPTGIAGMGVVVTHGEVILAGGFSSAKSWSAPIKSDGSLGAWTQGPSMDTPRFHTSAVAYGDDVFAIGGLNGTVTIDEIARSHLASDGTLGPWSVVSHLPYTLSHHASVLDGATLYVIGGQTGNTNDNSGKPHKETLVTTIGKGGSIAKWSMGPELPEAYETSPAVLHDGFVFVAGGIVDAGTSEATGVATTNVLRARVLGPGKLDAWNVDADSALPMARSHVHQTPVFRGFIYSVSGMAGFVDTQSVFVGSFH